MFNELKLINMYTVNTDLKNFFVRTKLFQRISDKMNNFKLSPSIEFNLPYNTKVSLILSDRNGNDVLTLIDNEYFKKGFYNKEIDSSLLQEGEYKYRIVTENYTQSKVLKIFK